MYHVQRIDMYHAVFDGWKAGFDLTVHLFGNTVGEKEGLGAVSGDLYIDINPAAELTGTQ